MVTLEPVGVRCGKRRPRGTFHTQCDGGGVGPVGVGEQRLTDLDQFGRAIANRGVRDPRIAKAPGDRHRQPGLLPNARHDGCHEGRPPWDGRVGRREADADADQIDPYLLQLRDELDRLLERLLVPAVIFDDAKPNGQRVALRPDRADGGGRLEQEARAVDEAAAVRVLPMIGVHREEALRQIAVCEMKLEPFEPGIQSATGGLDEVALHAGDIRKGHCLRDLPELPVVKRMG